MLFRNPVRIIEARQPGDVLEAFAAIEEMLSQGFYLAGYFAYEAGFVLESALINLATELPNHAPLLWFGCYGAPKGREERFGEVRKATMAPPIQLRYSLAQDEYEKQVEQFRDLIASGETYQANLTMEATWETDESPAKLFDRLLHAQPVPYAALLHPEPGRHVLSLSPELFFERQGNRIRTKPMKGTAVPGRDAAETRAQMQWLHESEKNRAENVMIVDLLRSDLGRICEMGSVKATKLFSVEKYPTVLQMTSTVEGRLRESLGYKDIFGALFPSGSIVGAPKIHTMRLLQVLEKRQRGVYTGAIGYMTPYSEAEFNVAIRTISLRNGKAHFGVGSGVTFDSDPALEFAECITKTTFLTREPEPEFNLIETFLLDKGKLTFLDEHLDRMARSAEYFNFIFDSSRIRRTLQDVARTWSGGERGRVRLLLNRNGDVTCTASQLLTTEGSSVGLLLADQKVSPSDRFLRHKTTNRALYDKSLNEAQAQGFTDCLFQNTRQEVTEGAIHNVIAEISSAWVTPPLSSGVLPGIYRQRLLDQGQVSEVLLPFSDLLRATQIFLCNSVRGMQRVSRIVERRRISGEMVTIWNATDTLTHS